MSMDTIAQSVIENPLLPGNVINDTGVDYSSQLLNNFLGLFLIAIFLIFFGYLIFGAIGWISAGGDKGSAETARGRVTTAIVGIAIVFSVWAVVSLIEYFFSVSILSMDISPLFLTDSSRYSVIENPLYNTDSRDVTGANYSTSLVSAGISLAMVLGAVIFFLVFVIGAIQWISSGGDKNGIESARGRITNALIGLVIMFAIWAVVALIGTFFGLKLFTLDFSGYFLGQSATSSNSTGSCSCSWNPIDRSWNINNNCTSGVPVCSGGGCYCFDP